MAGLTLPEWAERIRRDNQKRSQRANLYFAISATYAICAIAFAFYYEWAFKGNFSVPASAVYPATLFYLLFLLRNVIIRPSKEPVNLRIAASLLILSEQLGRI